jgi:hypothetical protein
MVKGVNKRVIEVNNTGNKFFEKIVIYVTPEYSNLSPLELKKATDSLVLGFRDTNLYSKPTLRRKHKRKKRLILCLSLVGFLLGLGLLLIIL